MPLIGRGPTKLTHKCVSFISRHILGIFLSYYLTQVHLRARGFQVPRTPPLPRAVLFRPVTPGTCTSKYMLTHRTRIKYNIIVVTPLRQRTLAVMHNIWGLPRALTCSARISTACRGIQHRYEGPFPAASLDVAPYQFLF